MIVIGCMTGTSIDGLDCAALEIASGGPDGKELNIKVIKCHSIDFTRNLQQRLREFSNENQALTAGELAQLQLDFASCHNNAIQELVDSIQMQVDLISVHGQTVYHKPPLSWQMFTPAPLAERFNCEVICDLRAADIAAGGQGAPITPLADYHLFRDPNRTVVVINLGGFCNVTYLFQGGQVTGKDVCPVNQLLDAIAQKFLRCPEGYDKDGASAMQFYEDNTLSLDIPDDFPAPEGIEKYEEHVRTAISGCDNSHSLGTDDAPATWLDLVGDMSLGQKHGPYIAYQACRHIAKRIANEVKNDLKGEQGAVAVLAGGGARHKLLYRMLQAFFGDLPQQRDGASDSETHVEVALPEDRGVACGVQDRESISMAILGYLCHQNEPITLPVVTGVDKAPVSGMRVAPPYR